MGFTEVGNGIEHDPIKVEGGMEIHIHHSKNQEAPTTIFWNTTCPSRG